MESQRVGRNDPCPCGSGRKYKQCCLNSGRYQNTAMPTPRRVYGDGAALLAPPARPTPAREYPPRTMPAVTRVSVDYTSPEPYGQAEVNYCFEVGHLFPLVGGYVVPVERVGPGTQFHLDNGGVATVTAVMPPKVWPAPPAEPDADGNYLRRVIGRIKRTGFMVLDTVFGGQTVTTTPGHLFYSLDRRGWVGAEALRVGEALQNDQGERLRLDSKGRIRHGHVELYNIEVEQLHTYFVGRAPGGAALVHNGTPLPGGGCIPKPAAVEGAVVAAQRRTLYHYTTAKGHAGITSSESLRPSLKAVNPKDARFSDGQYLSDIVPGAKTPGQLAYAFLNDPRGWRRFTHYVEVDVTGLKVVEGRAGVFVIHNSGDLNLSGRIVGGGIVPRPPG